MSNAITDSLQALRATVAGYESALVAYSGGVDSTVVLAVAREQLGERALGVIGNSPAYPASELAEAVGLAVKLNFPLRVIQTNEHLDPAYVANNTDRCFVCRTHLFEQLMELAAKENFAHVLDGVHRDDLRDHAGGMKAARDLGVRSPLLETGLGKAQVREIARHLDLPVWDKPAAACLASRVPTGTPVSVPLLSRIGQAEQALRELGFDNLRVRHHGELARIELSEAQMPQALQLREQILVRLRRAGYHQVTLDLQPRC